MRELSDLILQNTGWRYEVQQYYYHGESIKSVSTRYTVRGFYGSVAMAQVKDCDLDWAIFLLLEFKKTFPRGRVEFPKIVVNVNEMERLKKAYFTNSL